MTQRRHGTWLGLLAGAFLTLCFVVSGAGLARADGPQPNAAWPEFKRDGARSGVAPVNGPYTPKQAWQYDAGSPIVSGPVIDADGTIYIGTERGELRAVRPDGTTKWTYSLDSGSAPTHPLVNSKGHIVFGQQNGYIISLAPSSGNEDWRFDLRTAPYGDGTGAPVYAAPAGAANYSNVLIGTDLGVVYELDEGGAFKGVRRASGSVRAGAAVTPDGTLIWAGLDKIVYGGFTYGGDKWHFSVDAEVVSTPGIGSDSTTYVATMAGTIYAIRSDGTLRWQTKLPGGKPVRSSPAVAPGGAIYVGSDDGALYALDASNGKILWTYQTGAAVTSSPTVGANGLIYVGSNDSNLYVLTADGKLQASFKTGAGIDFSSPAIASNGTLYIGSRDGKLYALMEGAPTPTPTSAVPTATPTPPATPTPTPTPLPTDRVAPMPGALYFNETGHNVSGTFLAFFNTYGGLEQFGYPRTEEINENGLIVQYFQRARFEHHPEFAGTPYEVELTLLGDLVTASRRPFPTATPVESTAEVRYFPEVQHTASGIFLQYFDAHGGLNRFGYPISEQLQEQNNDGSGRVYTVQYFQRARLEYHPELAGTPYEIELGLLGDQVLRDRGWLR